MDEKQKSWDDDWLIYGSVIAFTIIGLFAGWAIGSDKQNSIFYLIIWVVGGGLGGFVLGAMIGGFLDSIFESDVTQSAKEDVSPNENQNPWEKFADEFLKIYKDAINPYSILESSEEDDFETIKINYRRLVRQYHPDHLGSNASEAIHKHAKEMSQKINDAYGAIKKMRGVK